MSFNIHNYFSNDEDRKKFRIRYLVAYNTIQTFGWAFILIRFISHYTDKSVNTALYDDLKYPLAIFQTAAFLEYYHALFKLTNSSPVVTFQQLYSRFFVVWLILMPVKSAQTNVGLPMLILAWSVTEIIRYSNYALAVLNQVPYFLVWLRYTTFIVLYPLGVTGELLCMYWAVNEVIQTRQWCLELPNKWNMVIYYHYYILFNMSLYIPFFPQLYMHMFVQRKKALGTQKQKEQ